MINNILLIYLWCILNNVISYTEELVLSMVYIILFVIISVNTRNLIKNLIVNQTLKIITCYEQMIYLKIKVLIKNFNLVKLVSQQKYIKNIFNIITFELKKKNKNYLDNKKKVNNIKKIYNILFLIINKI